MTPVEKIFDAKDAPKANVNYGAKQSEYESLPAFRDLDGVVVTRWKLTWLERLEVFFSGDLWLTVLTFNQPLCPVKMETKEPELVLVDPAEEKGATNDQNRKS